MNLFAPVSSIMSTQLIHVSPEDNLLTIQEIFDLHRIHHIPVVHIRKVVGMISKSDFAFFMGGLSHHEKDLMINNHKLERTHAKDIMTQHLGKIEPTDRINVAIEIFNRNLFHALPVVKEDDELVGILTTYDIIRALSEDMPKHPEDVYTAPLHDNAEPLPQAPFNIKK